MNQVFSRICKLLVAGFCAFLLMGNTPFAPSSSNALAVGLPPGEYELPSVKRPLPLPSTTTYSPYAGQAQAVPGFPQHVLWGDTHLHTVYSFDAGVSGTLLTPEASYRFARGEEVLTDGGERVQLSRPLDFLAVTDHTDQLGSFQTFVSDPPQDCGSDQDRVDGWHEAIVGNDPEAKKDATNAIISAFAQGTIPACMLQSPEEFRTAWEDEVNWAEEFNEPNKFTAMIAYEWTSLHKGDNLHRNIMFRNNGDKAKMLVPKTTEDGFDPELLWEWMENYEDITGGDVLAIPHNGNMSNGEMFSDLDARGLPLSHSYAKQRQRWEPLYEVIQAKGASETNDYLSPDDEFASFETAGWMNGNLDLTAPKTDDMYEHEYARAALKNGLKFEKELGANPFKFGLLGSTDFHIALSAVEEDSYMGKFPLDTPSPDRATELAKASSFAKNGYDAPEVERLGWQYGAAGYVGVWALENTRESLFDAMARREVYGTSGPRITVRLFGGWDFDSDDLNRDLADVGYAKGVPMGSDLTVASDGQSPTFLVAALKDPLRANLDRIQIVKGWLDANGDSQEKVYNVAWSDDRALGSDGKLPPVGNTVNTETAEWTNTIGALELTTVWEDPDFDPTQKAFYYARVLEIPTPRWTDYDKAFYGKKWCLKEKIETRNTKACDDIPLTLQERVYTSPIWYSPA